MATRVQKKSISKKLPPASGRWLHVYLQHAVGTTIGTTGLMLHNDVSNMRLAVDNVSGTSGLTFRVGTTNYNVWNTGNLPAPANSNIQITAGNGMDGGGSLAANRVLRLGTPSPITFTSTDSVTSNTHTHSLVLTAANLNTIYGFTPANTTSVSALSASITNLDNTKGVKIGAKVTPAGASVLYTGIPAGVAKFTINFRNVNFSAGAQPFIKVGPSSGVVSTGYSGAIGTIASSTGWSSYALSTSINILQPTSTASSAQGSINFVRIPGTFDWLFNGHAVISGDYLYSDYIQGGISLGAELDRFQFSTLAGTATMSGTAIWADWEFA